MNIKWEADKYKNDFSFVHKYGEDVLGLIEMPDNIGKTAASRPKAVDLGCGSGTLTKKLAEAGFNVIGIDDSDDMLRAARGLYPELEFIKGNAVDFKLNKNADVIFSNAVFHWIDAADQEKMAINIYNRLNKGGQLVCEFGGRGCAEAVHSALERIFLRRGLVYPRVFFFPSAAEYASILENAGFRVESLFFFDRPTPQKGEHGLADWIRMFIKKPFEGMAEDERDAVINEAEAELKDSLLIDGMWYIDYVRIRVRAVKR